MNKAITSKTMENGRKRKGMSVVFFSVGLFAVAAVTGLSVDGSGMFFTRLQAQVAADAGALAAAQFICNGGQIAIEIGKATAAKNGIVPSDVSIVAPAYDNPDWVECTTAKPYTFKFLAALGFNSTTVRARALARATSHRDDIFQEETALFGRAEVEVAGRNLIDRWDSRRGTYADQATNTDAITGLTYANLGANARSDCFVDVKGRNLVTGSLLVADTGADCSTKEAHFKNRAAHRRSVGDSDESSSGCDSKAYSHSDGGDSDGGHGDDHGDGGDGHDGGGSSSSCKGDELLQSRGYKRDADEDGRKGDRQKARCQKAHGHGHEGQDESGELRQIAQDMRDEGDGAILHAADVTGPESTTESSHGQKMKDEAAVLESIAGEMNGEDYDCRTTPPVHVQSTGHGEGETSHSAHDDSSSSDDSTGHDADSHAPRPHNPGSTAPAKEHCGILEIKGHKNHVQRDAKSSGPVILRGNPSVDGQVLPYNDVEPYWDAIAKPVWTSIASNNQNSMLAGLTGWNASTRSFKLTGKADVTLPEGEFYIKDIVISGHSKLRISGSARLYVDGKVRVAGHSEINPDKTPDKLVIYMKAPASDEENRYKYDFSLRGHSVMRGVVLNETGDVEFRGKSELFGQAVAGNVVEVKGGSGIHLDVASAALLGRCVRGARLVR